MDLQLTANKIASKYIDSNVDMNDSIAKYAMDNSLNIEQTKRLVEESNKTCYLQKFASTGEQIFDVAQYNIVKEKVGLANIVNKTASIKFTKFDELEKVAEENVADDYQLAIDRCRKEIGSELVKLASTQTELSRKVPGYDNELNITNIHESAIPVFEKLSSEINASQAVIEKKEKIIEYLIEKRAGIISGVAGGVLKGSAKVVGKGAGFVAEAPFKRGLMPLSYAGSFKEGMKKVPTEANALIMNKSAEVTKEALDLGGLGKGIESAIEHYLPGAMVLGGVGVGIAAARGTGGIVSRMMQERQLNESFNTIYQANADIRQIPNARAYYDVIARHSPSLANDPMVAPQLIRQFDTFGGVDVNTVGKLREIQDRGTSKNNRPGAFETAGNLAGSLKSFGVGSKEEVKPGRKSTFGY